MDWVVVPAIPVNMVKCNTRTSDTASTTHGCLDQGQPVRLSLRLSILEAFVVSLECRGDKRVTHPTSPWMCVGDASSLVMSGMFHLKFVSSLSGTAGKDTAFAFFV